MTKSRTPQPSAHPASRTEPVARVFGDQPVSLLFRGARRMAQFGRMLLEAVRPAPSNTASTSAPTLARYHELINSLDLPPDRPMPLTRFEYAVPGESTLTGRMSQLAARLVVENYCAMKSSDPSATAMRDQHAKTHGCVEAEFIVRDDLPAEFTTPLFRPGARYPAIVRFSNGQGIPQSDKKMDARGMSIKLRNVDAPTVLHTLAPHKTREGEHDFALSTSPVFFCKSVVDYSQFMEAITASHATWRDLLRKIARGFAFVVWHPRQVVLFLRTGIEGMLKSHNPLSITYHSMSPFLFGENKVVRYVVSPARRPDIPDTWWTYFSPRSETCLQDALVRDLDPDQPGHDVVFDFSIRVRHAATPDDAEDASRRWNDPLDRTVQLGTIVIPKQTFLAPDQVYDGERMTFNPWNCVPQHRPIGSVNRMRLAVYLASQQVRRRLNMVSS
jgi:Catalase